MLKPTSMSPSHDSGQQDSTVIQQLPSSSLRDSLCSLARNCSGMAQVIEQLGPERYAAACDGGSIGPHIRHCLDHLQALACFLRNDATVIDYEQRRRGWCGETDPQPATSELNELANFFLYSAEKSFPETAVTVLHIVDPDRPAVRDQSSLTREIHFCLSHSVHHQALIAMLAKAQGLELAPDFGYAPSTLAAQRQG